MARTSIEITFLNQPPLDYVINFTYYTNPTVNNTTAVVTEVVKTTRAGANQVTTSSNMNTLAANYAAALAIDYPTFSVVTSGNKVTVTSPNGSPIFNYPNNSDQTFVQYVVDTGSTNRVRFLFNENPFNLFTTPFSVNVPTLVNYNNLLVRFNTSPVETYDSFLDSTREATSAALMAHLPGYITSSAPMIVPYTHYRLVTTPPGTVVTEIVVNYQQKIRSTLSFSGNPAAGTQIIFSIKKNNLIIDTINKTFSTTLDNFGNVLLGATVTATIANFVDNLLRFNTLGYMDYFAGTGDTVIVAFAGTVKDLFATTITTNTTGVITLTGTADRDEPDTISIVAIPNEVILENTNITKVRSSELYISTEAVSSTFDTTEFKIFAWTGSVFSIPADPYIVVRKAKVRADQTSIFININNYFRTGLKGDIFNFIMHANTTSIFDTSLDETKWGKVISTNFFGEDVVSEIEKYYYVVDGYVDMLDIYTDQDTNILMTGEQRYVERGSRHNVFFKNIGLTQAYYITSANNTPVFLTPSPTDSGFNTSFVQGAPVKTDISGIDWIEYVFDYDFDFHKVRYYLYDGCNSEGYQLVFKNRHGMLEGFPVTGRMNKSLEARGTDYLRNIVDVNGAFDLNDHARKQFNVTGNDNITFNTDWLPEYMNAPLKELSLTEELWIVDSAGNALPVVKVTDNVAFKTQRYDKLIQYTIAVKLSHDTIKLIQ